MYLKKFYLKADMYLDQLVKGLEDADRLKLWHGEDLNTPVIGTQKYESAKKYNTVECRKWDVLKRENSNLG